MCSSSPNSLFIHEKARYSQDLLEKRSIATKSIKTNPVSDLHRVTIAIKQQNLDEVERILYEVSIPTSPRYGQHWTKEQVDALTSNPTACNNSTVTGTKMDESDSTEGFIVGARR